MKKKSIGYLVLIIAVLISATAAGFLLTRPPSPVSLVMVHTWNQPGDLNALSQVLSRFHSLYPHITVIPKTTEQGQTSDGDVVALTNLASVDTAAFSGNPVPWTGAVWLLAGRKDILDAAAKDLEMEVRSLREGKSTPETFEKLLSWIADQGWSPITLGNSHRWPFLLWLEHWSAAVSGTQTVNPFPLPGIDLTGKDSYALLKPAYNQLMEWKTRGWFAPGMWKEGWARGLTPLDQGKAAFALVSQEYLSPIQPENLSKLEFLPFPRSEGSLPWSVGSATFLMVKNSPMNLKEAELLVHFLTSPGITQELTKLTGKPFFSWKTDDKEIPLVIPSWADAAMTKEYENLSKEFDPGM